jgi:hypothetical protein
MTPHVKAVASPSLTPQLTTVIFARAFPAESKLATASDEAHFPLSTVHGPPTRS